MPTYEITCTIGGWDCDSAGEAVDRSLDALDSLRDEGVDIEHDRSTIRAAEDGTATEVVTRLSAPTAGTVGRHVCLARLPASGIRRVDG
jgi:hypothetical protein